MLDLWNLLSVRLFDVLLGWLLDLPRSLAVLAIGLTTAALLTLIRKWTTNQDRLRRAAADLRRLKELKRTAVLDKDRDALARMKLTKGRISFIKLKAEGWPTLAVIVPVALLATWAFERLAFHSPRAGQTITVKAYLVDSKRKPLRVAENDLMHLVPQPGLRARNGWVQPVRLEHGAAPEADVVALWQLEGDARSEPYPLVFRWKEHTFERELRIGQRLYSPALVEVPGEPVITEVRLREVRLFGITSLGRWLPAWLVGYLLITFPFVFLLKRALRIY